MQTINLPTSSGSVYPLAAGTYTVTVSGLGSGSVLIETSEGTLGVPHTDSGDIGKHTFKLNEPGTVKASLTDTKAPEGCKVFIRANGK